MPVQDAISSQMTINLSKYDIWVCGSFNYGLMSPVIEQKLDHLTTNGLSQLLASARALDLFIIVSAVISSPKMWFSSEKTHSQPNCSLGYY